MWNKNRHVFGSNEYRGADIPRISGIQVLTLILTVLSVVAGILIIANLGAVTANIAIGVVKFLSSGIPILLAVVGLLILIARIKLKMHRKFRGW